MPECYNILAFIINRLVIPWLSPNLGLRDRKALFGFYLSRQAHAEGGGS